MAKPVGHVIEQGGRFVHDPQNRVGQLKVSLFTAAAYVVDLANLSLSQDLEDCRTVIAHVNPVADIQAVAVNRDRLIPQQVGDE